MSGQQLEQPNNSSREITNENHASRLELPFVDAIEFSQPVSSRSSLLNVYDIQEHKSVSESLNDWLNAREEGGCASVSGGSPSCDNKEIKETTPFQLSNNHTGDIPVNETHLLNVYDIQEYQSVSESLSDWLSASEDGDCASVSEGSPSCDNKEIKETTPFQLSSNYTADSPVPETHANENDTEPQPSKGLRRATPRKRERPAKLNDFLFDSDLGVKKAKPNKRENTIATRLEAESGAKKVTDSTFSNETEKTLITPKNPKKKVIRGKGIPLNVVMTYQEAKEYVQAKDIKSLPKLKAYLTKHPAVQIPKVPDMYWKKEWEGCYKFFGTKPNKFESTVTFEECIDLFREKQLKTSKGWLEYVREANKTRPQESRLPSKPNIYFSDRCSSWSEFAASARLEGYDVNQARIKSLSATKDPELDRLPVLDYEKHKIVARNCLVKNQIGWEAFVEDCSYRPQAFEGYRIVCRVKDYFSKSGEWQGWDNFWGEGN
ncbi:hypothetical protein L2734_11900 [Parashewanella spongiae]|uniref:hypothetical protein n=1 Tax=Parashewanella spongiae TaxID=342950 RepID=UPI00105A1261|nr:hypothetical protein [Parashewanella spongiae]MCL1078851.1 hypothetical protein [Parashewanella spongiae]